MSVVWSHATCGDVRRRSLWRQACRGGAADIVDPVAGRDGALALTLHAPGSTGRQQARYQQLMKA